jgi:hypothetical protein
MEHEATHKSPKGKKIRRFIFDLFKKSEILIFWLKLMLFLFECGNLIFRVRISRKYNFESIH